MPCVDITPSDLSTTAFIEAWISHITENAVPQDVLDDDRIDETFETFNFMSRTPSPSKKRKPSSADTTRDHEITPRPPGFNLLASRLPTTTGSLDEDSVTSHTTSDVSHVSDSSGARSGACSPKKREGELRDASDHPLERYNLRNFPSPTPLMRDLLAIKSGPVIPHTVKDRMSRDSDWMDQPDKSWFYPQTTNDEDDDDDADAAAATKLDIDTYTYMRIQRIQQSTTSCKQTMEHEAGWNDMVHSQLLELALADERGVSFRNIVLNEFREKDVFLNDAKVDYAILLAPDATPTFANSIQAYRKPDPRDKPVVHVNLPDRAATPVTVSIETKSANADVLLGRVQLATWVRAHFRQLEQLPSAGVLPILPLVLVDGSIWTVDFAHYTSDSLVVWDGFSLGSSDTVHGCYTIIACLRRLATWSRTDFASWFEAAIQPRRGV